MGSTAITSMGVTFAAEARNNHRGKGADRGVGGNTASLSALNPPSPSSPRRRSGHNHAVKKPGGSFQESTAEGSGTKRDNGGGVGAGSNMGFGGCIAGSDIVAAGNGTAGTDGHGRDEDGGCVVLLTPTLEQVSLLVAALEAPQVPTMGFVVVCPLYTWNQERDEEEIRRLREFTQVGSRIARL